MPLAFNILIESTFQGLDEADFRPMIERLVESFMNLDLLDKKQLRTIVGLDGEKLPTTNGFFERMEFLLDTSLAKAFGLDVQELRAALAKLNLDQGVNTGGSGDSEPLNDTEAAQFRTIFDMDGDRQTPAGGVMQRLMLKHRLLHLKLTGVIKTLNPDRDIELAG